MRLLLASKSAARRHMLEAAGVEFETCDAPLDVLYPQFAGDEFGQQRVAQGYEGSVFGDG